MAGAARIDLDPRIRNAESLARGSPAGGAGKALGVAGNLDRPQPKWRTRRRDPSQSDPPPLGLGLAASRSGKKTP